MDFGLSGLEHEAAARAEIISGIIKSPCIPLCKKGKKHIGAVINGDATYIRFLMILSPTDS